MTDSPQPVSLVIEGRAKIGDREVVHKAVPAEDRMQAFLWRHLVPANDFEALVFSRNPERLSKVARAAPPPPPATPKPPSANPAATKVKFTKQQVANRLRQLKLLLDDGLLTKGFYNRKVAECEAAM